MPALLTLVIEVLPRRVRAGCWARLCHRSLGQVAGRVQQLSQPIGVHYWLPVLCVAPRIAWSVARTSLSSRVGDAGNVIAP